MDEYLIGILNRIGDPIFVKDDEHRLLKVNEAFCEMFGMVEADVLGQTLAEHVPDEERTHFLSIDRDVLDTGKTREVEETLTLDGRSPRYIITKKYRFIDSHGRRFLIGIIHDITNRREVEVRLEEQREALSFLNERKDKILSVLSHDLRAPINSIIGLVGVLQLEEDYVAANATCQSALRQINEAAHVARDMMENLLEWAVEARGDQTLNNELLDLNEVVKKVLKGIEPSADLKGIELVFEPQELHQVRSDKRALGIVLRNLIQNAIKFTARHGRVSVQLDQEDKWLIVRVIDNGIGMHKKTKERLLAKPINPTRLGTADEKGAGLGIALCNEFVTALGGEMQVESTIGEGSTFSFTLPKAA
jgi:PAS domain S-box-containing protein